MAFAPEHFLWGRTFKTEKVIKRQASKRGFSYELSQVWNKEPAWFGLVLQLRRGHECPSTRATKGPSRFL
jgi:hypothetical protein